MLVTYNAKKKACAVSKFKTILRPDDRLESSLPCATETDMFYSMKYVPGGLRRRAFVSIACRDERNQKGSERKDDLPTWGNTKIKRGGSKDGKRRKLTCINCRYTYHQYQMVLLTTHISSFRFNFLLSSTIYDG